eukprot:NODE_32_length_37098_cov_1.132760.p19 type:complete len:187 gc:universal NODE_32_length_37098_cov_1.132760:4051-4611(+)
MEIQPSAKLLTPAGQTASELEINLAQALIDLEQNLPELKPILRPLQIVTAKIVQLKSKKALLIYIPVSQIQQYHKVQSRLMRELEKKFNDYHCLFVAFRRILPREGKNSRQKQPRPRSRTLTSVHNELLEELVFPNHITGKRIQYKVDGRKIIKAILDSKNLADQHKLDTLSGVYKQLTGKDVVFE